MSKLKFADTPTPTLQTNSDTSVDLQKSGEIIIRQCTLSIGDMEPYKAEIDGAGGDFDNVSALKIKRAIENYDYTTPRCWVDIVQKFRGDTSKLYLDAQDKSLKLNYDETSIHSEISSNVSKTIELLSKINSSNQPVSIFQKMKGMFTGDCANITIGDVLRAVEELELTLTKSASKLHSNISFYESTKGLVIRQLSDTIKLQCIFSTVKQHIENNVVPGIKESSLAQGTKDRILSLCEEQMKILSEQVVSLTTSKQQILQFKLTLDIIIKNDATMVNRISEIVNILIPAWKNQLMLVNGAKVASDRGNKLSVANYLSTGNVSDVNKFYTETDNLVEKLNTSIQ